MPPFIKTKTFVGLTARLNICISTDYLILHLQESRKNVGLNKKFDSTKMTSMANIIKAADFAAKKHRDQRRKGPDKAPYINHPIGVANILANEGGIDDPIVLQAALLHDTVEDTETSLDEIEQEFGKIVRDVVDEVTDQKDLPSKERKRLQVINAPKKSPRAKLVKLADKLYNLRDLHQSPPA